MSPDLVGIFTAIGAIGTALGVAVAVYELHATERARQYQRTVEACERFALDADLARACARLAIATKGLVVRGRFPSDEAELDEEESLREDASRILFYLELICQGVEVGIYDADLVKSYLGSDIVNYYLGFLSSNPIISTRWREQCPKIREFVKMSLWNDPHFKNRLADGPLRGGN